MTPGAFEGLGGEAVAHLALSLKSGRLLAYDRAGIEGAAGVVEHVLREHGLALDKPALARLASEDHLRHALVNLDAMAVAEGVALIQGMALRGAAAHVLTALNRLAASPRQLDARERQLPAGDQ